MTWQLDLSARPQRLVDRSMSTIRLAASVLERCAHQTPGFARQAVVGSCLSFAIEQQNSVGLLIATGRDSSASVLVRPILEALCVSAWSLYRAPGEQLISALTGQSSFPALASLISQLEATPSCAWLGIKQRTLNARAFHALAHPSPLQLSKRYNPDKKLSAFTVDEGLKLLWLADTLTITLAAVFSVATGSKEIESWAGLEMDRLMSDGGQEWEHWGDLPPSQLPIGPQTPIISCNN